MDAALARSAYMESMLRRSFALALVALAISGALGIALHSAGAATVTPAACAPKAPIELPYNSWPAARKQLAPPGASAIRLCRYNGLNTKPYRGLAAQALVTSKGEVATIVGELDALPRVPPGAIFSREECPADDGSLVDALIAYPGGHGVLVSIELGGCFGVTNGNVMRTLEYGNNTKAGSSLLATVKRLTGWKPSDF
jgi:hypothetical protein